jgi:hypothetical protein
VHWPGLIIAECYREHAIELLASPADGRVDNKVSDDAGSGVGRAVGSDGYRHLRIYV